jgi:hypothetical protein
MPHLIDHKAVTEGRAGRKRTIAGSKPRADGLLQGPSAAI